VYLGQANDSVISGVFVTRGPEIKVAIEVSPNWESYTHEKIDLFISGPRKEFFESAMTWDLEMNDKN